MPPEQIIPILKKRLEDGAPEPDQTALLLAWFGNVDGQARLIRKFNVHAKQDMAKLEDKGPDGYIITDVNGKTFEGDERTNYSANGIAAFLKATTRRKSKRQIQKSSRHLQTNMSCPTCRAAKHVKSSKNASKTSSPPPLAKIQARRFLSSPTAARWAAFSVWRRG